MIYSFRDAADTIIETPSLILRGWRDTDEDIRAMYAYARHESVGYPAGWKFHSSPDESKKIIQSFIKSGNVFAIVGRTSGIPIGSLGIHSPKSMEGYENRIGAEIGYVLSPEQWGKGLMPEAVKAAIRHSFTKTPINILFCGHFDFNTRSRRVIEKCGFTYWRDIIYNAEAIGKTFNESLYILTKENWTDK